MKFDDLVIIVAGTSSGIGFTLAEILANKGAKVIGVYNLHKPKSKNKNIEFYHCNIASEKEVYKLFNYVKGMYNHINFLVNCVAAYDDDTYQFKKAESFLNVIKTNILGTFLLCKYATIALETGGVVVNLSSLDATETYNEYNMDYACSKAAVENLTRNFAKTVKTIKTVALAPAWVDTESTLAIDPEYLKKEMEANGQSELLTKEEVALKIIEMMTDSKIESGEIIKMNKVSSSKSTIITEGTKFKYETRGF